MRLLRLIFVIGVVTELLAVAPARAAEKPPQLSPELTALLAREKAYRKACKIEICAILASKSAEGDDIACHVIKTWLKSDIEKIIARSHVGWPWGHARCQTDLSLPRATLVAAMREKKYVAKLASHRVTCVLDREKKGDKFEFEVNASARITFENAKAMASSIKWGKVEAPTVVKGVLWSATGLDNKLNIFGSELTRIVNEFVGVKCAEVKDDVARLQ